MLSGCELRVDGAVRGGKPYNFYTSEHLEGFIFVDHIFVRSLYSGIIFYRAQIIDYHPKTRNEVIAR